MRKAAKLEKSEEEAYIHFLEELSTEELNIKQTASYLKGEHCNQLFELRFHPAMRASNHQTPETHEQLLRLISMMVADEAKFNKQKSARVFLTKCLELFFCKEEIDCLGSILGMSQSEICKESISKVLEIFFSDSCDM